MTSLAVHDRLFGTTYVADHLPHWLEKLDTEFTDESGSIIGLRSQHTGLEVPFPVGEATFANYANCFAPERGRRLWAIARHEMGRAIVPGDDGRLRVSLPGKGLDAGGYTTGFTAAYAGILCAAREFGDDEIAEAAQRSLDLDCGLTTEGGVRRYMTGSNLSNVNAVMGQLMRTGDFRRSFAEGPPTSALRGPVLAEARYPDVLVARAFSRGDDLDLVLYPGNGAGKQTVRIERLKPGRDYIVQGQGTARRTATADGTLDLDVTLEGRTAIKILPA
jgi:hypothetical protein